MSYLTRIKNNQITDATILANVKVVPGSIVGSLFNSNLTMTSDVTITGNLVVQGSSTYLTVASTNTYVNDPLIVLNNAFAGTNTYDLGFIFNRGSSMNQAIVWNEFNKEFRLIHTTETGTTYGNVTTSGYSTLHVGNLTVESALNTGSLGVTTGITGASLNVSGNVLASTLVGTLFTGSGATLGSVSAAVIGNTGAYITGANLNITSNILASSIRLSNVFASSGEFGHVFAQLIGNIGTQFVGDEVTVSGNATASNVIANTLSITGNVIGGLAQFAAINDTPIGNLTASTGRFTSLTATSVNSSGNILATTLGASFITASTAAVGNISAVTIGNAGATVTGTDGTFGQVSAGFVGNTGTQFTGASLNVSGNILASTVEASYATASTATFGNVSAVTIGNAGATVTGTNGTFGQVNAGIIGNSGAVLSGASLNVSGNVLASTVGASFVTASTATFGNVDAVLIGNTSASIRGGLLNITGNVLGGLAEFSAINATPIGNATPSTGAFTNITASSLNTSGNVLTSSLIASYVSASTATLGNISAVTIGNAGAYITGSELNISGNTLLGLTQAAAINATPIGNASASTGSFTDLRASQTFWANSTTASTNLNTGAAIVAGGLAVNGNLNLGGNATVVGPTALQSTLDTYGITKVHSTINSTSFDSGALIVDGGVGIAKDVYIQGNLYVNNISAINYAILSVTDPLLYLTAANTYPYNYDIGFFSQFTGGTGNIYQHTGIARDNDDAYWKFFSNVVSEPNGGVLFDNTTIYDGIKAGNLILVDTTAASSTSTGALVVSGGAGVGGRLYAGLGIQNTVIGNVTPQEAYFTTLNATGNVLLGLTQASAINATPIGNATPSTGDFTTLTASSVNASGNILASTVGASYITASTATVGNISAVTIGNAGAYITGGELNISGNALLGLTQAAAINATPIGNASPASAVFTYATAGNVLSGFVGNTGTQFTGASLNVSGNVLASTVGASFVTASTATIGNLSAGTIGNTGTQFTGASLNVSGNVLASTVGASFVTASTAAFGNISADLIGNVGAYLTAGYGNIVNTLTGGLAQFQALNYTIIGNIGPASASFTTLSASGVTTITEGGEATNYQGGALRVTGGLGVSGNIYHANAYLDSSSTNYIFARTPVTINAFSSGTSIQVGSAAGVLQFRNPTIDTVQTTLNLFTANATAINFGSVANITLGAPSGITVVSGGANIQATTASSSYDTGALQVQGGVGVRGSLNTLGNINTSNYINVTKDVILGTAAKNQLINLSAKDLEVRGGWGDATGNLNLVAGDYPTSYSKIRLGGDKTSQFQGDQISFTDFDNGANSRVTINTVNRTSTSATTGALTVDGGVGVSGNLNVSTGAVFNLSQSTDPFQVKGTAASTLIYAIPGIDVVSIGGSNTTPYLGVAAQFNGSAIVLPTGPTSGRPSVSGNIDAAGMLRFNTSINNLEFYDGTQWSVSGSSFTIIASDGFTGNGIQTVYNLDGSTTTAAAIVSVNGIVQLPTTSYSITGNVLTFTEAPADGDVIDVRRLTTTATVNQLSQGYAVVDLSSGLDANIATGTSSSIVRISVDDQGIVNLINGTKIGVDQSPAVVNNLNLRLLDSFSANTYTTAKYVISMKQSSTGNVSAMEALLTQNTNDAYITTYAVVNNGNTMGTLAANISKTSGWTVNMWLIPNAGTVTSNVKVYTTYIV